MYQNLVLGHNGFRISLTALLELSLRPSSNDDTPSARGCIVNIIGCQTDDLDKSVTKTSSGYFWLAKARFIRCILRAQAEGNMVQMINFGIWRGR